MWVSISTIRWYIVEGNILVLNRYETRDYADGKENLKEKRCDIEIIIMVAGDPIENETNDADNENTSNNIQIDGESNSTPSNKFPTTYAGIKKDNHTEHQQMINDSTKIPGARYRADFGNNKVNGDIIPNNHTDNRSEINSKTMENVPELLEDLVDVEEDSCKKALIAEKGNKTDNDKNNFFPNTYNNTNGEGMKIVFEITDFKVF